MRSLFIITTSKTISLKLNKLSHLVIVYCILISCGQADPQTATGPSIDPELEKQWKTFQDVVARKDYKAFEAMAFDTLIVCDGRMSTKAFISQCYDKVFEPSFFPKMKDPIYTQTGSGADYFPPQVGREAIKRGSTIVIQQYQVKMTDSEDDLWAIAFDFVKTANGYKLSGCDTYGGPKFCKP